MTPILTAAAMRSAEDEAIAAGTSVETLMERAGAAVADLAWRMSAGARVLIACGPGNNGGDGYVAARILRERGLEVRVAALGEPRTPAAIAARGRWAGPVEALADAEPAAVLVDCLFGTGLTRRIEDVGLLALHAQAKRTIAVDLPSGVATDDGAMLGDVPRFDATIALGALKPAHLLQPAAALMGALHVGDIGLGPIASPLAVVERPHLSAPGPQDHKYKRGKVAILGGAMPGAALLAAEAAARAGAGYVELLGARTPAAAPYAIVRRGGDPAEALRDHRIGALVVGPGLGRDDAARDRLALAIDSGLPLVLDADALMLDAVIPSGALLTPHEGEFAALFGELPGSKVDRARAAAKASGAVVLLKGADSVVASPDGRAAIAPPAPHWLATAGTGDALAGIAGAMRARGLPAFEAACAAAWLHSAAARAAGPGLIADDLARHLPMALAQCR